VIPIFLDGKNIGQIDIDSNSINSFNTKDVKLLEAVCEKVSMRMKKSKISIYEFN
jgi:GAF domain-containing protein